MKKRLEWYEVGCKTNPAEVVEKVITKQIAEYLIRSQRKNRGLSITNVERIKLSFNKENFEYKVNSPICFDEDNRLCDGQHRLRALIESNIDSHKFMVRFGVTDHQIDYIDINSKQRTFADSLTMRSVTNATKKSAVANIIFNAINQQITHHNTKRNNFMDMDIFHKIFNEFDLENDDVFPSKFTAGKLPSIASAMYVMFVYKYGYSKCAKIDQYLVDVLNNECVGLTKKAIRRQIDTKKHERRTNQFYTWHHLFKSILNNIEVKSVSTDGSKYKQAFNDDFLGIKQLQEFIVD